MDKKKYWILCLVLIIFIILFILGSIYIIYLLKDRQEILIFSCIYIFIGVFHCVRNVKLLINLREVLNSEETSDNPKLLRLKKEYKGIILPFVIYIISIPFVIAVLHNFIINSKSI